MEHWILHYATEYDAVRWPFGKTWDEFAASPEALAEACEDFGRAAPCDSLSETPHVPPNLPRLQPRGKYRAAIYHDATWLYAFIEAHNGPILVSDDALANIPHLRGVNPLYPTLVLLSRDQRFIFSFGLDGKGQPLGRVAPLVYGARKRDPGPRELTWDLRVVPRPDGELTCFRVARACISEAFDGDVTRVSLTRMHFGSVEAVAWGSHTTWGVRPDEMRTVRLVERRDTPPWPKVRRVDMLYEPATERARIRVSWDGPYEPSELGSIKYLDPTQQAAMDKFVLACNEREHLLDLREEIESPPISIPDGHNRLRLRSTGGPQLVLELEKWSGNRIVENGLPDAPVHSSEWILSRLREETEAALKRVRERAAQGEARKFAGWVTYEAAALGRAHHYLTPDPRLLDALRVEADFALSLQRPDGSFAGLHTARYGKPTVPWAGGAYDTGPAGELWVLAARLLGDQKYLDASSKLVRAYKDYRVEFNYNFAAFALYHLVTHYALTHDELALEHALYYARHCVAIDILPLGFQAGHNYYSCYGSITLRAIALLAGLLPDEHPYKAVMREQAIRMANQAIMRQQPDGSFDGRDRYFIGRRWWMWGLFPVAFLLGSAEVARLDKVIQRMLDVPHTPGNISTRHLLQSDAIRYFAHRDKLLAGERVDLAWLV